MFEPEWIVYSTPHNPAPLGRSRYTGLKDVLFFKGTNVLFALISVDPIQASNIFSSQKSDVPKDAARSDASVDGSTGTFTRFTHAAEVLATQAATQAPPFLW